MNSMFYKVFLVGSALLLIRPDGLNAQGVSRSTGLGVRGGFWKLKNQTMGVEVSGSTGYSTVDVAGVGGSLYFFSRLHNQWFLEANLGSVAKVHVEDKNMFESDVDVEVMIPFVFGARYDFLSYRANAFQPYLCGGGGPYWKLNTQLDDNGLIEDSNVRTQSDFNVGCYIGVGTHIALSSWFALAFDSRYHCVDFSTNNPSSGFELGFGCCFMWGRKREIFRLRDVRVNVEDIYPAYYQFYNIYPIASATVQNTAGYPIQVNLTSWIDGYTQAPRQSGFTEIPEGATLDLPVYLLFGAELLEAETREPAVIKLEIEAQAGVTLRKTFSAQVTVHSRNAWNGDIDKLGVFVTPDHPVVLDLSREILKSDSADSNGPKTKFEQAKWLFNALQTRNIRYQSDPNIPFYRDDRVQLADKTLSLGSGDCDDLVVLYASLLESVGISTAFVDVKDPEKNQAHVYLVFDTELPPNELAMITSNEKKTILRSRSALSDNLAFSASGNDGSFPRSGGDRSTLWIPVETTLIHEGFENAWKFGATEYLQEGIIRNGLTEGWVNVIDIQ